MEATLLGIRAVSMSQEVGEKPVDFSPAEHWGPSVLTKLLAAEWPKNVMVNVNFPARRPEDVKGITVARHGNRKIGDELTERVDPRGRAYFWIGTARNGEIEQDTDVHALMDGRIAVTPLNLDLSDYPTIATLRQAFA